MTITATGWSKYQADNSEKNTATDTADWTLSFENPCTDASFVTINDVAQVAPVPDSDNYSSSETVWTYYPLTANPNLCPLTTKCLKVEPENARFPCTEINGDN